MFMYDMLSSYNHYLFVTIQSSKTNRPKIKERKASKAEVPVLDAVDVSDFKIKKSL